jgi:hypothetical protein
MMGQGGLTTMNRIAVSLLAFGMLAAPALAEVPAPKAPATSSAPAPAAKSTKTKAESQKLALAKKPAHRRHHRGHATAPTAPKPAAAPVAK